MSSQLRDNEDAEQPFSTAEQQIQLTNTQKLTMNKTLSLIEEENEEEFFSNNDKFSSQHK